MALEEARGSLLTRSTAEGAAVLRAAGHELRDPALRNPDHLAGRLIAPSARVAPLVKLPVVRRLAPLVVERILPGGVWFEVARTRGFDDLLTEEVAAGARQVVLLGAGLDSRAFRLAAELAPATVWEVDHPVTARYKRERVRRVIGAPPANRRTVELDFAQQDLGSALAAAGHDAGARSVVVWSGVTPYLEAGAVVATLRWFSGQAPGSVLGFDYIWRELLSGALDSEPGVARLRRLTSAQGEPFRWGIPRGGTAAFLAGFGLELVEDVEPAEAEARYLRQSDGARAGRLWPIGAFARVRVPAAG